MPDDDTISTEDFFWKAALAGPLAFFKSGYTESEVKDIIEHYHDESAREHVVLRALGTVQMYGLAAKRWQEAEKVSNENPEQQNLATESYFVEQAVWARKLLEALVTLVNFSSTNDNRYFAHFVAVSEFTREHYRCDDERKIFGLPSPVRSLVLDTLEEREIALFRQLPDSDKCWYVRSRSKAHLLATQQTRYFAALKIATEAEKTALGYMYNMTYGATSEIIHFSILKKNLEEEESRRLFQSQCGLLTMCILVRAHELCGVAPQGINKTLTSRIRKRKLSPMLESRAVPGDFVLCSNTNYLAEVLEVQRSEYGYERYRVLILDRTREESSDEVWLPAPAVHHINSPTETIEEDRRLKALDPPISRKEMREDMWKTVQTMRALGVLKRPKDVPILKEDIAELLDKDDLNS